MAADFAKRQLEKHGWKTGAGLGRKEDGRSQPIKVSLKMDKTGVGHDPGKEFTDHWWLRVFNDAAKKIGKSSQDEVSEKAEQKAEKAKTSLYKGFVKGSTLTNGLEKKDTTSGSSSEEESDSQTSNRLPTLDEIHKFCGGATGHRAARFGIKMKGKLARVAEHDRKFEELKVTSIKKKAYEDILFVTKLETASNTLPANDDNPISSSCAENSANGERERGKKKKKRRHNSVNSEDESTMLGNGEKIYKQEKKKKKKRKGELCTENSPKALQDGSCETWKSAQCVETVKTTLCTDHVSKSRKSKRGRQTVSEAVIHSEPEVSHQSGKKKKKKKREIRETEDKLVGKNELSQKKDSETTESFTSKHRLKKKKKSNR